MINSIDNDCDGIKINYYTDTDNAEELASIGITCLIEAIKMTFMGGVQDVEWKEENKKT